MHKQLVILDSNITNSNLQIKINHFMFSKCTSSLSTKLLSNSLTSQSPCVCFLNLGYDVWMGNTRGNTYSKNHIHLDPCFSCPDFWDFGWHEAGREDLSAAIDKALETTQQDAVYYVGHSQGTTEYLVKYKKNT